MPCLDRNIMNTRQGGSNLKLVRNSNGFDCMRAFIATAFLPSKLMVPKEYSKCLTRQPYTRALVLSSLGQELGSDLQRDRWRCWEPHLKPAHRNLPQLVSLYPTSTTASHVYYLLRYYDWSPFLIWILLPNPLETPPTRQPSACNPTPIF